MTAAPLPFYARLSFILISLFIIGAILFVGSSILLPIFFAILLAMLLLPLVNAMTRKGLPDGVSIVMSVILALLVMAGILYFLGSQVALFVEDLPAIQEKLNGHLSTLQGWLDKQMNIDRKQQDAAVASAKESMQSGGSGVGTALMGLAGSLASVVLLPIYTFLILFYRKLIYMFFMKVFKSDQQAKVQEVLDQSKSIVQGYMVGLLTDLAIVVVLNTTGFLILGIEYAIFLAVLAAILNLIPYVGMLVASVICMAVTLTTSENITDVVWVAAILLAVQFVENNFIMPFLVSSKVQINAMVTIMGVIIGGSLAGIGGMFLSIPGIAILKVIFDRVDGLKAWGYLLGEGEKKEKKLKKRLKATEKNT